jgi:two-component system, OmpR family, sensor kinase
MKRPRFTGLRTRLLLSTLAGSLLAVCVLVAAFNLVLDARLRSEADNLLRDRAAAQLRTVSVLDGQLKVPEAPDRATPDTQTWIFAGRRTLEQPVSAPANQQAALALVASAPRFLTVGGADLRLYAVPIVQSSRRLGTLVVGASLRPYDSSAHTALVGSVILGVLTVLGIALASAWATRRALAPVARMTASAAEWGEHDLSRRFLAGEPHDELSELAATFDRLLDRSSQSLKREQRFTAEISHELRTPLTKILAEAELAASKPERYGRALESIRASAESLGRSLEVLLATARAETPATPRSTNAHTVAEHAAQSAKSAAAERGLTVQVTSASSAVRVAAEADLLERALAPIVENAVRFARNRVDIAIRTETNQVIFEVRDDGPGVNSAIREQIFEPGVSHGANGGGSGAGLGLPLARRLARAAGGEIRCLPAVLGASFALSLPMAEAKGPAVSAYTQPR